MTNECGEPWTQLQKVFWWSPYWKMKHKQLLQAAKVLASIYERLGIALHAIYFVCCP
jgi:hypothetical protein